MCAIVLAVAVQSAIGAAALACDGQAGNVIFEDAFADDSGGWDFTPATSQVKPPDFVFTLTKQTTNANVQNLTFNATIADFCADFALPKSPAPDNAAYAALTFWGADYANFMMAMVSSTGGVGSGSV